MRGPARYERTGQGYAARRTADPRIAAYVRAGLGGAHRVVNVGAGPGSYEQSSAIVAAVEPSRVMLAQRAAGSAPAVQAVAESLPFGDDSFDAALAVLTMHHWTDVACGLRECARVAERVVLFTWDPESAGFWLTQDYLPAILTGDRARFPAMAEIEMVLGRLEVTPVPIPGDCADGFLGAYWRRPASYLDAAVRRGISSLMESQYGTALEHLRADLASGTWHERHGGVLERESLDLGYRLVVARAPWR